MLPFETLIIYIEGGDRNNCGKKEKENNDKDREKD